MSDTDGPKAPGDTPSSPEESDEDYQLRPSLARPRPLIAATVIALGSLIVMRLARDIPYALSPDQPKLVDATQPIAALVDDTYVRLSGLPDRRNALYLAPRGGKTALLLFRLLGSDSKLFVRAQSSTGRDDLQEAWQGRLRKFDAMPYADTLRDFYTHRVRSRRYIQLDGLWNALRTQPLNLTGLVDRLGRPLTLPADGEVELNLAFSDQFRVLLPKAKFPTEDDAKHELERLGYAPVVLADADERHYSLLIAVSLAERNATMEKLTAAEFIVRLRDVRTRVRLDKLSATATELIVPAELGLFYALGPSDKGNSLQRTTHIRLADVQSIGIDEPVVIPADAYVLLEDESPHSLLWTPIVAGFAVLFVLFNFWYVIRSLRRRRK
jgi:hypothetical protein